MWTLGLLVGCIILLGSEAYADIYKCPDGKGGTRFQDMPCAGEAAPVIESRPPAERPELPAAPAPAPSQPAP